jgi:hypothetical protein
MPTLDKNLFIGESEIDVEDCVRLEVRNFTSDLENGLKEFGWKGEAAACIGITLSADNARAEQADFFLVGPVGEYKEDAARIWPNCKEGIMLRLKFKSGAAFRFVSGQMVSDILPQEMTEHAFYKQTEGGAPTVILEAEYEELGIGEFCVRAICCVSKNSSAKDGVLVKYSVLLFPLGREELLTKFEAAREAAWPGLLAADGECPLLVKATTAWGCPIWPLLLTGADLEQHPRVPVLSGEELRAAISCVMASGIVAETSRSTKSLTSRWRKLAASAEELTAKKSQPEWPKPRPRQQEPGK